MSLEVVKEPYEISLARNPVEFHLRTNNLFIENDVYPSLTLVFNKKAIAGDGFHFTITDPDSSQPIFFVFNASPVVDAEGWKYYDDTYGGPLTNYVQGVFNQLILNVQLATFYNVEYDGNLTITLTALLPNTDLIPTDIGEIQYDSFGVPYNHVDLTVSETYLSKTRRTNFRVLVDVYFEKEYESNEWTKVATLKDEPDSDGLVTFDLSSIVNAELKACFDTIPVPTLAQFDVTAGNKVRKYYIAWTEYYDGQTNDLFWYVDQPKLVHMGGVSIEDFAKQNAFHFIYTKKQFLTWQPNSKNLTDLQNDWLTWINYLNQPILARAQIKVYFTDATDSGWIDIDDAITLQPWEEILIPVGYVQRDIQTISGIKEAYKWEVNVKGGSGVASETRIYYRLDGPYLHNTELCYLNAFGCPETFNTTGEWEEKMEVQKQFVERALASNYNLINGQEFQFDYQAKNNYIANTGWMAKQFIVALRDILMVADVFMLDTNEYIPIIIEPANFQITTSLTFLNQLKLSIRRSFKVGNYSVENRIPVFTPILECGIVGFSLNDNTALVDTYGAMKVSKDGVLIYAAIPYVGGNYNFTGVQTEEGIYRIEVVLTLEDTSTVNYDFNYNLRHQKAFIDLPQLGITNINTLCETGLTDKWYANWGEEIYSDHDITDVYAAVSETLYHWGVKRLRISTLCPQNIKRINLYSNTGSFDLTAFYNLEILQLIYADTAGLVDLSAFKKLTTITLIGNDFDDITLGFHPGMVNFNLSSNQLTDLAIENLLLQVWKYRKYYTIGIISLNVAGNPGAGGSMTTLALDIINGTGAYVGEGLTTDYSFSITY